MSAKKVLIDDSSDSDDASGFKVNEEYAEKYNNWRKKEEYQRLKDKYGDNVLSEASGPSASESDSDEDSDPEEQQAILNGDVFDDEFLRVYQALIKNDPIIYDASVSFVSEPKPSITPESRKKRTLPSDHMNLLDYHLKLETERKGLTEEDLPAPASQNGYFEELSDIKSKLKAAIDDDGEDEDQLLQAKPSAIPETKSSSVAVEKLDLGDPENDADKFLRNFILKKSFLDDYEPLKGSFESSAGANRTDVQLQSDESEAEATAEQAAPVKHRFEEAGASELKRYPRTLSSARDLVQREGKSTKRKESLQRKKAEKSEELKKFSELRRQELASKLSKLQETSGNSRFTLAAEKGFAFQSLVNDDLFDPEQHDEKMRALFDTDYYDADDDVKKPQFEFVEGIDDDLGPHSDLIQRPEQQSEAEDDENEDEAEDGIAKTKISRKKKKQRKRKEKKVDLDKLPDYDDIVGGQPVRFKYCRVTPNDFGLSAEEILLSDEKELNAWVSLKKAVAYRDQQEEEGDVLAFNAKRNDYRHKEKILKSLFTDPSAAQADKKSRKRRRRAKGRVREDGVEAIDQNKEKMEKDILDDEKQEPEVDSDEATVPPQVAELGPGADSKPNGNQEKVQKKSRSRKRKMMGQKGVREERLLAYGFTKKEMKRKRLL